MYREHWGLRELPFRESADPACYVAGESYEAALLKMRYVVEHALGAALVVGDAGTGKTYLTRLLGDRLPPGAGPVVRLVHPRMSPEEYLNYLAAELARHTRREAAHPTADPDRLVAGIDASVRRVHRLLDALASDGRHPVLVVDEVHLVEDARLFHTLHLLLNHQPHGHLEFSLILVGLPAVLPRIERVPQLEDRIAVKGLVRRLNRAETAVYVTHRLGVAGRTEPIFEPSALHALWECSMGLPRRLNRLCDMALLVGYADDATSINAGIIEGVAEELVAIRAA